MVKQLKLSDPNFADNSAAVRHYVNVGIAAETATTDLRNSLDNSIVRRSIKTATKDALDLTNEKIDQLAEIFKSLAAQQTETLQDITNRARSIESKLDTGNRMISEQLESVQLSADETLRNAIILRCISYVFLIGHKTGRIAPGVANLELWRKIVFLTHDKVNNPSCQL